jgi:hypothetical protein
MDMIWSTNSPTHYCPSIRRKDLPTSLETAVRFSVSDRVKDMAATGAYSVALVIRCWMLFLPRIVSFVPGCEQLVALHALPISNGQVHNHVGYDVGPAVVAPSTVAPGTSQLCSAPRLLWSFFTWFCDEWLVWRPLGRM